MKPIRLLLSGLLALPVALAGCATGADSDQTSSGQAGDEVSIGLDWTPNTNHTGIYVAQQKGYYADAGIDLNVLGYSQAGVESVMGSGGADFGFSGVETLAAAKASDLDLTMVFNLQQRSSYGVAVRQDSDIASPKDLDGKTLAAYGAGATSFATTQMIQADGGQGNFDTVVVGTGALDAVVAGKADFAEALATWEVLQYELQGDEFRMFFPDDYGVPTSPALLGISARSELIADNPDLVARFVQATEKGYEYAVDNPDEAAQILIDANPQVNLDPELTKASQELLSSDYWPDPEGSVGHADPEAWQTYLDLLTSGGLVVGADGQPYTSKLNASELVTNEFLA